MNKIISYFVYIYNIKGFHFNKNKFNQNKFKGLPYYGFVLNLVRSCGNFYVSTCGILVLLRLCGLRFLEILGHGYW